MSFTKTKRKESQIPFLIKVAFIHVFSGLLIYWAWAAFERYFDQLTASFTTYTQGDDDVNVVFPFMTFCRKYEWAKDSVFNNCDITSSNFRKAVSECLVHSSEYDSYLKSLYEKMDGFILQARLENVPKTSNEMTYVDLTKELGTFQTFLDVFYDINIRFLGICIMFDPTNLNLTTLIRSKFHLEYNKTILGNHGRVILHEENSYPEFLISNPYFDGLQNGGWSVAIKKKIITTVPTRKSPCGDHNMYGCYDIKRNQIIADKFKCKVSFLYNGRHLNNFVKDYDDLPFCNQTVIMEAADMTTMIMSTNPKFDECLNAVSCKRVKLEYNSMDINDSYIEMRFSDTEVEHHTTYISYDLQSLIGELGGILGMFLGCSGLSLAFSFVDTIARYIQSLSYC